MEEFEVALTAEGEKFLSKYNGSEKIVAIPSDCEIVAIGEDAFLGNCSIEGISIPETVEQICSNAFFGCKNLKSVKISSKLQEINLSSFENCENLSEINFPKNLRIIGPRAFKNCPKLLFAENSDSESSDAKTPSFLIELCEDSFDDTLNIFSKNPAYIIKDGIFYNQDSNAAFFALDKNCETLKLEKNTKYISWNAFAGCKNLKNISIPDSVVYIGRSSFLFCENLERVILPKSVKSIDTAAFWGCKKLKEFIVQGNGLEFIAESSFSGCEKLLTVTVPADCNVNPDAFELTCKVKFKESE